MNAKSALWLKLSLCLAFFLITKVIVSYTVLSSFNIIIIDAEFSEKSVVDIFYSSGNGFQPDNVVRSGPFPAGKRVTHKLYLKNKVASAIRIDTGDAEGEMKFYGLRLASFYGDSLMLSPKTLFETYKPNSAIATFSLKDDYLLITSNDVDPYILSTEKLEVENFFLKYIFPFVISLLFWLLIRDFSPKSFAGFSDLNSKNPMEGAQIRSLDGVRGIAALLVLLSHSGRNDGVLEFNPADMGALGVWLFFCLSGFLLAKPFIKSPEKAYSIPYLQTFFLRRILRILPMYYTIVIITMMFRARNPDIFRHLLFLQGDGHLWTIQQEMFFYLLLPFVMLICCAPIPRQKIVAIPILLGVIHVANTYLTTDIVSLFGNQKSVSPFIGYFLSGVVCSFIFNLVRTSNFFNKPDNSAIRQAFSILGILLLLFLLTLTATDTFLGINGLSIFNHSTLIGLLCSSFILLVALSGDSLLGRMMSFLPFRAIGLVGYSFYLLHPTLIGFSYSIILDYFNYRLEGFEMFIVAGIVTYVFSLLTYTYIERPFFHNGAARASKAVFNPVRKVAP